MREQQKIALDPDLARGVLGFLALAGAVYVSVIDAFSSWVVEQNEAYERAAVKRAVSLRKKWKVSDVANLRTLPLGRISQQRLAALERSKKRGRPVVQRYRSLPEVLVARCQHVRQLFDTETPPHTRLQLLSQTKLWPYIAEALYRGCYAQAKSSHTPAPSTEAEYTAAESMVVSVDTFRKLCQRARTQRRAEQSQESPAISRDEFEEWKRTGRGLLEE